MGTLTNHFCGVGRDSFSVSPDGGVTACFEVFSEDNPSPTISFMGELIPKASSLTCHASQDYGRAVLKAASIAEDATHAGAVQATATTRT